MSKYSELKLDDFKEAWKELPEVERKVVAAKLASAAATLYANWRLRRKLRNADAPEWVVAGSVVFYERLGAILVALLETNIRLTK